MKIVLISFQDHSVHTEGTATPVLFVACGLLLKEDAKGYLLGHWIKAEGGHKISECGEITSYVAKVRGLKIQTVGRLS